MHEKLSGLIELLRPTGKYLRYVQEVIEPKLVVLEREVSVRERFRHMLLDHSDFQCGGEKEFLLGLSEKDPHPEHKITITKCDHPEWQKQYGSEKTNLGWIPQNFRPEKLAI